MKLWTIQERSFVEADLMHPIVADLAKAPQNWRNWYAWMTQQWNARVGIGTLTEPIWCWHSCNGIHQSCPTVGTLAMLMGDWNYYSPKMIVIECNIPDNLVLLSSYSRWNEAICDAMDRKSDSSTATVSMICLTHLFSNTMMMTFRPLFLTSIETGSPHDGRCRRLIQPNSTGTCRAQISQKCQSKGLSVWRERIQSLYQRWIVVPNAGGSRKEKGQV